ncbi:MAG: hypothetical protein ACT6Q8_24265 [Niveispirillum sp.]|uniref:hypothetical protein n=1 Tax=Niveispirillum sp. TaxID=1917217 RepID=UPI004034F9B3
MELEMLCKSNLPQNYMPSSKYDFNKTYSKGADLSIFFIALFIISSLSSMGIFFEAKASTTIGNKDTLKIKDQTTTQKFDVLSKLYLGMEEEKAESFLSSCADCIKSKRIGMGIYTTLSPRGSIGEKSALLTIKFSENRASSMDLLSSFVDPSSSENHFNRVLNSITGSGSWMTYYPNIYSICRISPNTNSIYMKVCKMTMGLNPAVPAVSVEQKFLDPLEKSVEAIGTEVLFTKGSNRMQIEAKMMQICKIMNDCRLKITDDKTITLMAAPQGLDGYGLLFNFSNHSPKDQVMIKFSESRSFRSKAEMDSHFAAFARWPKTVDFSNNEMEMVCVENITSVGNNKVCKTISPSTSGGQNYKYEVLSSLE